MTRPVRSLAELRALAHNVTMLRGARGEAAAAVWVQQLIEDAETTDRAPADVRAAVDVAVELHVYGTFSWALFTVAVLQARLTYELALGIRFFESYGGRVPMERREGGNVLESDIIETTDLRTLRYQLSHRGTHRRRDHWRLVGHRQFDADLLSLYYWARAEGVIRPWLDLEWARHADRIRDGVFYFGLEQPAPVPPRPLDLADWTPEARERWLQHEYRDGWEQALIEHQVDARNDAAHPVMQSTLLPTWSADEIEALVQFVNTLWP
jgi:hypothetical protein